MNRRHPPPRRNANGAGVPPDAAHHLTALQATNDDGSTVAVFDYEGDFAQGSRRHLKPADVELGEELASDFAYFCDLVGVAAAHVRGPRFSEINRLARLRRLCLPEDAWLHEVEQQQRHDQREAQTELRTRARARRVDSSNLVTFSPRGAA